MFWVMRSVLVVMVLAASSIACDDFVNGYDDTVGAQSANTTNKLPLVLANYDNGSTTQNSYGGVIQCENCSLSNDGNALHFAYTSGSYFGVDNSLNQGFCPQDLSAYSTLTFSLRASAGGRVVEVMLHEMTGPLAGCDPNSQSPNNAPDTFTSWNVTAGTTLQTFSLDLTGNANRKYATYLEMDPQTLNASDNYILNMITFHP